MIKKQRRFAITLLGSLCVSAYAQSSTAGMQCEKPAEELKQIMQVSAGGPYQAKVGVPITLHGTYTIAGQTQGMERLKAIGQALQAYLHDHGTYPPAALLNAKGQATVSWRVLILPYLGHKDLYDRFDLTKPWNDPANQHLLRAMPAVYANGRHDEDGTETGFAGVQGVNSLFEKASAHLNGGRPVNGISQVQAIGAGPVGSAVHLPWTAPGDIDSARATQLGSSNGFSGDGRAFTPLVFLDGSVYLVPNNAAPDLMEAWTQVKGKPGICYCAPPSSFDIGLQAAWDLGSNGAFGAQGFDPKFVADRPGQYTVTVHVFDRFGDEYNSSTRVEVR